MRALGHRLPCRICGADRTGQPINSMRVAVCADCWPSYLRDHNEAAFVALYLGERLKSRVREAAEVREKTVPEYIRLILKLALDSDETIRFIKDLRVRANDK